jgi:hypothetical protein
MEIVGQLERVVIEKSKIPSLNTKRWLTKKKIVG